MPIQTKKEKLSKKVKKLRKNNSIKPNRTRQFIFSLMKSSLLKPLKTLLIESNDMNKYISSFFLISSYSLYRLSEKKLFLFFKDFVFKHLCKQILG